MKSNKFVYVLIAVAMLLLWLGSMYTPIDMADNEDDKLIEDNLNSMGGMMDEVSTVNIGGAVLISSLEPAKSTSIVELNDGDEFTISADIVRKVINGNEFVMYAYNGMIPGVALRVNQGSRITLNFVNNIDQNTTIHWHGLRQNVKDDGVPSISQPPVQPGETYVYNLYFPDEGIYWYHPHIREDIQQDGGLAGNMLVDPASPDYYNEVNREELLVFDDILIEDDKIVPFGAEHANFAIMGRFGNVLLLNGDTNYNLKVDKGEIVRFYITNVANVRPLNISFGGARMKLIGGDIGKFERETFIDGFILAPAQRVIIEVYFEESKDYDVIHAHPDATYVIGKISVSDIEIPNNLGNSFLELHENIDIITDIDNFREFFDKPVDIQLNLTIDMPGMDMDMMGMMMDEDDEHGIEWEDTMKTMNSIFTGEDLTWIILNEESGEQNMDINMGASVGDLVKLRLFNDPESMHPMQHPIHLHGQRFLVLNDEHGDPVKNMVWTDTVLVTVGSSIDILIDITNPGEWMMHCHIAEHLESGMMTTFEVSE